MIDPRKLGARCDLCPRKGKTVVLPEGPTSGALYCWLGQDPGEQEEKKGRPFIGPTGVRLERLWTNGCAEAGLTIPRRDILIINSACCRPVTKRDSEAKAAADCCAPLVQHFLKSLSPVAGILVMGRWAYYQLTGRRKGIGKYQGYYVRLKGLREMPDFEAMAKKQRKAAEKAAQGEKK